MTEFITRTWPLDDVVVRTAGDGRTVEAYAAVFNEPAEINDQFGHYIETIHRSAFNTVLNRSKTKPIVLFNHGRDLYGNSSDRFALPIGRSETISADKRGLLTVTRIAETPFGDEVLTLMRDGTVTGFSFTGAPIRSQTAAPKMPGELPTITRTELGLSEYGPGVMPAYDGARLVAMRAQNIVDKIDDLPDDQLTELVEVLRSRVPDLATGQVEDTRDVDDTGQPDRAAREFDYQRRQLAARLRGLTA